MRDIQQSPGTKLIVASTNEETADLNKIIRQFRHDLKELGPDVVLQTAKGPLPLPSTTVSR